MLQRSCEIVLIDSSSAVNQRQQIPLNLEIPIIFGILLGFGVFFTLVRSVNTIKFSETSDDFDAKEAKKEQPHLNLGGVFEDRSIPNTQYPVPDSQVDLYDWDNISNEAVGILIAGNSGSAKTCLATWLLGKLTQKTPAQVIALDPHANRNRLWKELGVFVIGDFHAIEAQLRLLEDLLDNRRNQSDNGDLLIVVADELGACIKRFADHSRVQNTLERLGSEGRKYGILLISLNASANSEDIGVSAQYKNNFIVILLRAAAISFAERTWKRNDKRREWVSNSAYPTVISGAVPHCVAKHPTHGHHEEYAIVGKEPRGILPVNQLPLTIPLANNNNEPQLSEKAQKLHEWFVKKTQTPGLSFNLRKIQQSRPFGKNETHKTESITPILEELIASELIEKNENENYSLTEKLRC